MAFYQDQSGRTVEISDRPKRIVSLVPSITELVCDLGYEGNIAGVTRFCVHPTHIRHTKQRIGGTKDLKIDRIRGIAPDLILANKEENVKQQVLALAEAFPIWVSDIVNFQDALHMIESLGEVLGVKHQASDLRHQIESGYGDLHHKSENPTLPSALYLIWKNPYMAAGTDTFISSMMRQVGLRNVLSTRRDKGLRYPKLELHDITALSPDYILLSSEPYPFKTEHMEELRPHASKNVFLVDGEAFSWYGSRMLHTLPYLLNFSTSLGQGA